MAAKLFKPLALLALVDISDHANQAALFGAGVIETVTRQVAPEFSLVALAIKSIQVRNGDFAGQHGRHVLSPSLALSRMYQADVVTPDQRIEREAEHTGHALVGLRDVPLRVDDKDRDAGRIKNLVE